jgi:hypothetical protein
MTTVLVPAFEQRRARFEELYGKEPELMTDAEYDELNDLYFGFTAEELATLEGVHEKPKHTKKET